MRSFIPILWFLLIIPEASGQLFSGATGLLNTPSAEMQQDGTLIFGANFLPRAMTPAPFNYDTGNYYFNLTFLPFFEFSYRHTLMKVGGGNINQDRSLGMRIRLLREGKYLPSLVIGGNDLYSSSGEQARYFNALYVAATRHVALNNTVAGFTAGYMHVPASAQRPGSPKGFFCGVTVVPGFLPMLRLIGEYDARAINAGLSLSLFRHLQLAGMLYGMKHPAAGLVWAIQL